MKLPCIADIEASGLGPESYPIEIAWSLPDGEISSWLIRPELSWTSWEPGAEALHHISRETLQTDGLAPKVVAEEMNRALRKETVYFDGGDFDRFWLDRLFLAAGVVPAFKFGDFNELLYDAGVRDGNRRVTTEALARKDLGDLPLHRAGNDVRFLLCWYLRARRRVRD